MLIKRGISVLVVAALGAGALLAAPLTASASPADSDSAVTTATIPASTRDDGVPIPARVGKYAAAHALSHSPEAAGGATTAHKIWISVVTVTGMAASPDPSDPVSVDYTAPSTLQQATDFVAKMSAYYSAESGTTITLTLGGFETRTLASDCSIANIYSASPNSAFPDATTQVPRFKNDQGIGTFDHLVTIPKGYCNNNGQLGLGSVGYNGGILVDAAGSGNQFGLATALHEFGHNLGFSHAYATQCATGTTLAAVRYDAAQASLKTGCNAEEYGDPLDLMGAESQNSVPHLSSPERILNGYMSDVDALTTGNTAVLLKPLGSSVVAGAYRGLKITDPANSDVYYVEYRTGSGADANSPEFSADGASIDPTSYSAPAGTFNRFLYDTNPTAGGVRVLRVMPVPVTIAGTAITFTSYETAVLAVGAVDPGFLGGDNSALNRDMHLGACETFTNYDSGFSISVNSLDPAAGAAVSVHFASAAAVPATTCSTLTVTEEIKSNGSSVVNGSVSVVGSAANPIVPAGNILVLDGTTEIARVATDTSQTTVPFGVTLGAGSHSLSAKFVPTTTTAFQTSASSASVITVDAFVPPTIVDDGKDAAAAAAAAAARAAADAAAAAAAAAAELPTVVKAKAKITVTLKAAKVKASKKAVVAVKVTGGTTPTGKVTILVNGKKAATGKLKAGKVSVTLPKITKKGKKTITVSYPGDANTLKVTSGKKTLTIV